MKITIHPQRHYINASAVAFCTILGVGDAMGLDFQDQLRRCIATPCTSAPSSLSVLAQVQISFSVLTFDEPLAAALLHAAIGGLANDFVVRALEPENFVFRVASSDVLDILLRQHPMKHRSFSLRFVPLTRPTPVADHRPASFDHTNINSLLHAPSPHGAEFQHSTWDALGVHVNRASNLGRFRCRMSARIIQFPVTMTVQLFETVLVCLFGGTARNFNVTVDEDDVLYFTVTDMHVAARIRAMDGFKAPGVLLRFPDRAAYASSAGSASSSSTTPAPASSSMASSPSAATKVSPLRVGLTFQSHVHRLFRQNIVPNHISLCSNTSSCHRIWIAFISTKSKPPSVCLVKHSLDHCSSLQNSEE